MCASRKHREKLERIRKEPLMSDKEVPSWLKYEEEKKLSDGQVHFSLDMWQSLADDKMFSGPCHTISHDRLVVCSAKICSRWKRLLGKVVSAR